MLDIRSYIYALDNANRITAALPCPDEKTAQRAYQIASQKMKVKNGKDEFLFRCIEINALQSLIEFHAPALQSGLIRSGYGTRRDVPLQVQDRDKVNIVELERAESETKEILSDSQHFHRQDLQFMRYVKLAMEESFPDKFDPIDKTKGRWVSQKEFLEIKNRTKKLSLRSLQTYRTKGEKSKDKLSGIDSQNNHWRKHGTGQAEEPEYFLLNDK